MSALGDVGRQARVRVLTPFGDRPRPEQIANLFVLPIGFGYLSGYVLTVSTAAYWGLQVIATIGGFLGGYEHRSGRAGMARGALGGVLFGSALLIAVAVAGGTSSSQAPAVLPLITAVVGSLGGGLGGALRARHDRAALAPST